MDNIIENNETEHELSYKRLAFVVDGVVFDILHTEESIANLFLDSSHIFDTSGVENAPQVGWVFNLSLDKFVPPQQYNSWVFDEDKKSWVPPIPHPYANSGLTYEEMEFHYNWDEESVSWVATAKQEIPS